MMIDSYCLDHVIWQSGNATVSNLALSPGRRCLAWKFSENPCAECVRLDRQFAMGLPYSFAHSPDSDAGALRLNLSKSFLRHSRAVILNLHMDAVRLANNTD